MKKLLSYILGVLLHQVAFCQAETVPVYYTPVDMPASLSGNYYRLFDTKLLAEDLAGLLQKASGKKFTATLYQPGRSEGIFLILDNNKRSIGNETGIVETDGKNFIRISGGYTTGISYAMYSWLEELGFHFYLPGDEWTILPAVNSIFTKTIKKKIYKPAFQLRMFGASGGMLPVKGLDDKGQNRKAWEQWLLRNRMGCDYMRIDGHIGEAFNASHRKEIENDSLIVAPVRGKRQYNSSSKLDPTYKKGVNLFSDWIIDQFKKEQASLPSFLPFKKYYTVDAGDGLDYCHTPACEQQFKTVSDQAFSIANETARKIKLVNPAAGVSTLAYTERADTPSIRIEPNIHIMVVPGAFQSVGTNAELVKRWTKKSGHISVYDYLNIAVWSYDQPFFNLSQYHLYLQFLQRIHAEGISFESSYSKFGAGIQQYFILKFLCDPYASPDVLLDEFCKNNFGPAAVPIKKLLKEWYFSNVHLQTLLDYNSFREDELGRFVKYLVDAENKTGLSPAIKKRIEELKAYTIYLCKYYEWIADLKSLQAYAHDPGLKSKKAEDLLTYTWGLYSTKIFHNTDLNNILKSNLSTEEKEKWNYSSSDHFKNIAEFSDADINAAFGIIKNKYLPVATSKDNIDDAFLAAHVRYSADSIRIQTTDETSFADLSYPVEFYAGAAGTLKIMYQSGKSTQKGTPDKVAIVNVESADYTFIKTDIIYKEKSTGFLNYNIPARGHYKLYLSRYNGTQVNYIIYPAKNLFYLNKKSILTNGLRLQDDSEKKLYSNRYLAFYPIGTDSVYFDNMYYSGKNTSSLYSSSGKQILVKATSFPFTNAASIPKSEFVKLIFYENSLYRWPPVLRNAAPYYFFLKYPLK